jgi:hypothetical protein
VVKYFIESLGNEEPVYTFIHFTCTVVIAMLKRRFTAISLILRNKRHRRPQTLRLSGCKILDKNFYFCDVKRC